MYLSHLGTSINPTGEEFNKTQSTEEYTIAEQSNKYSVFKYHKQPRGPMPLTGLAPDLSIQSDLKEIGLYTKRNTSSFENAGNTLLISRDPESEYFYHVVDFNQNPDFSGNANVEFTLRKLDVYLCVYSGMKGFIREPVKLNRIPCLSTGLTEEYDLVGKFEPCGLVSSLSGICDHPFYMEPFPFGVHHSILLVSTNGAPRIDETRPGKLPQNFLFGQQYSASAAPKRKLTDIQYSPITMAGNTGNILESIARARQAYHKRKKRVERKIREVTTKVRTPSNSP